MTRSAGVRRRVGATPFVLVVNAQKVHAKNAKELQALPMAKPGQYNYASSGNGTLIHLVGEMFVAAVGVEVRHIPYNSGTLALPPRSYSAAAAPSHHFSTAIFSAISWLRQASVEIDFAGYS